MPKPVKGIRVFILSALVCVFCVACVSSPTNPDGSKPERSPADPWEPLNRSIHMFNRGLDKVTLKPVAKVYKFVIPSFMRRGVTNFSQNLRSPLNIINHFLQGKPGDGFGQTGRFLLNSTVGLGGLIDVAATAGLEQKNEDFGETLAVWGVPDGPYVIVPFLGPRTLRDAVMLPLNILADPLFHYEDSSVRDKVYLVRLVDIRARLLSAEELLLKDAYDPYIRIREAYLQHRRYVIYDGDPPEDDDFYDELLEEE
ncbi:MAG: VacJ family lipoprotein [Proteobacteria bacterium]|nr:VacJ family lipoprotein [Pseudomonadota bacterium]